MILADMRIAPTPSPHPCSPGTCTVRTGPAWRPSNAAATAIRPEGAWQAGGCLEWGLAQGEGATELRGEVKRMER